MRSVDERPLEPVSAIWMLPGVLIIAWAPVKKSTNFAGNGNNVDNLSEEHRQLARFRSVCGSRTFSALGGRRMSIAIKAFPTSDDVFVAWRAEDPIPDCVGFQLLRKRNGGQAEVVKNRVTFSAAGADPQHPSPS